MPETSPDTAVVIIPDAAVWPPIQALRRRYDPQADEVMPHITLLYPFRPRVQFEALAAQLGAACAAHAPIEITLARFGAFALPDGGRALWLAPEPAEPITALHTSLWRLVPNCDGTRRYPGGFVPHLSVGQAQSQEASEQLLAALQATWRPLRFTAGAVALLARDRPLAPFRTVLRLPLQAGS